MGCASPVMIRLHGHKHRNWTQIGCTNNDLLFIQNTANLCPIPVAIKGNNMLS